MNHCKSNRISRCKSFLLFYNKSIHFFYFTQSICKNTHIRLSIIHSLLLKLYFFTFFLTFPLPIHGPTTLPHITSLNTFSLSCSSFFLSFFLLLLFLLLFFFSSSSFSFLKKKKKKKVFLFLPFLSLSN